MRIKRANFRFNQLVNVDGIIGHSNLLLMGQEDINVDANRICGLYNTFINDNNTSYVIQ